MIKAVILLIIGFVLLIKGADFFVDGSSSVAKMLKVPSLIIGLTIVSMGTSLPELSVSVAASSAGNNSLAISNVIGSNIFNLMVVLGLSACMNELLVSKDVLKRDLPFSILCAILLVALAIVGGKMFGISDTSAIGEVGRLGGIILLVVFIAFLAILIKNALKARHSDDSENADTMPVWKAILFIVGGAVAVKFGGDFTVDGAVAIARFFGLSETLIGLTIVACGTSLPELVTSMVAAKKNELDMAIGNVVGSNIFNILGILGVAAVISPLPFTSENVIDAIILLVFSALILLYCKLKNKIDRTGGIFMVVLYCIYLVYICVR